MLKKHLKETAREFNELEKIITTDELKCNMVYFDEALSLAQKREQKLYDGFKEKILRIIDNLEIDTIAHSKGRCSFPLLALCSAEEHRIKEKIKNFLNKLK